MLADKSQCFYLTAKTRRHCHDGTIQSVETMTLHLNIQQLNCRFYTNSRGVMLSQNHDRAIIF